MSIYIGDKEIKNLFVGESISISDMQGPCPDGFHIPTYDEVVALRTLGTNIGAWGSYGSGTNLYRYLKTQIGVNSSGDIATNVIIGSDGTWVSSNLAPYWTSTFDGTSYYYWYCDKEYMSSAGSYTNNGYFIRPFKNSGASPDSNWEILYQGTGAAGIYRSSSLGLISIGDGTNRITIADKNLGATTVYNYPDTPSQANCGNCYQRGNNHGFPYDSTISSTTTKVNAANYGPGNYYSSNVYVKGGSKTYWDTSKNQNLRGGVTQGTTETGAVKEVYLGENKVRPSGPDKDYLCFTAEEANSSIRLYKQNNPTSVQLETSSDGENWTNYTFNGTAGATITLTNVGDKVYFRNKSETPTGFSIDTGKYYRFTIPSGKIAASGDVTYLLCKNGTNKLNVNYCFAVLFSGANKLTKAPKLNATTLSSGCYANMFYNCTSLTSIPKLPATTMKDSCYAYMFKGCSNIKLSSTQTGDYQTPYRIPTEGTGSTATSWNSNMFAGTGGTYTSNPSINTTYYTSNTVV